MNENFSAIHQNYVCWLGTLGFAKCSVRKCSERAKDFFLWLQARGTTNIKQITGGHIAGFHQYQQTRENKRSGGALSGTYLNDYFAATDKLMEFLHQVGAQNMPGPTNYRITVDAEERIRKIAPFTVHEIKHLQSKIPETYPELSHLRREQKHYQLKLIFALYYGCGLRLGEGLKLTPKETDFDRKTIFIQQGKGYKDRIVPMSGNVYNILQDYIYNFRNQFKNCHDKLFTQSPATMLRDLHHLHGFCTGENIQNKRLTFHILRHSIATHLLQNGMGIENIARFLGHGSLTSTQIYTHIASR